MKNDTTLKASFSNYGKTTVDVFAPGVQIYSSVSGSKYAYFDGTSMACPVVVGLAALIREYYPKLSANQVKQIIMESVVTTPYLKDRCRTGGIVNAYRAIELAEQTNPI
jgi:subtilisin family serine protease